MLFTELLEILLDMRSRMAFLIQTEQHTTEKETKLIGGQKIRSKTPICVDSAYMHSKSHKFRNNFQKLQACLAKQFDAYCYPDDIGCVNGNQTLGENAADLAGLQIAYKAYQQTTKQELLEVPMFTSDQVGSSL